MNQASAAAILVLLLFGPIAVAKIEHNIELYCLALGVLATLLARWVFPGVLASSLVAGAFARGEYDEAPAMEAGVTDRLWSLEGMVGNVDKWEAR